MERLLEAMQLLAGDDPLANPANDRLRLERPGYAEFCDEKLLSTDPHAYASLLPELVSAPDRLDALCELDVPALVMVGELDRPLLGASERMAQRLPGARLARIPGAGHSPQFEAPQLWADELGRFLAETRTAG
jgi:3-oxoadipate enol-lactonase